MQDKIGAGFFDFLRWYATRLFGTQSRGRWQHATKKGPGRRRLPRWYGVPGNTEHVFRREHPAGTKLVRRFIRQSGTESVHNRRLYAELTGHQYR